MAGIEHNGVFDFASLAQIHMRMCNEYSLRGPVAVAGPFLWQSGNCGSCQLTIFIAIDFARIYAMIQGHREHVREIEGF